MAASGARVIDLEEFRRRRAQRYEERETTSRKAYPPWGSALRLRSALPPQTPGPTLCVWYPVWYWVPVVAGV